MQRRHLIKKYISHNLPAQGQFATLPTFGIISFFLRIALKDGWREEFSFLSILLHHSTLFHIQSPGLCSNSVSGWVHPPPRSLLPTSSWLAQRPVDEVSGQPGSGLFMSWRLASRGPRHPGIGCPAPREASGALTPPAVRGVEDGVMPRRRSSRGGLLAISLH